jgi:hypothetical protein
MLFLCASKKDDVSSRMTYSTAGSKMVSSGRGKKMSILGGPFLGQHCMGCDTLCYVYSLSMRSSMGLAPTMAMVTFFWNLSDVGDRAMMEPAFKRFDVFQSIMTPARKVEKHILIPNPR